MARMIKALRHGAHFEHYEITQVHKDGHPIDTSVTISPVKGKGGAVVGASLIARDITRRSLILIPTRQGHSYFRSAEGEFWRTFVFIEGVETFEAVQSPLQ